MHTSLTARALCLLAVAVVGLSGCGLKGDLYLPEPDTAATGQSDESSEDDDDTGQD